MDAATRTVADPLPITPPIAAPLAEPLTAPPPVPAPDVPRAERIAVLRSNEPWWRTAWAGAKAAAISALTFWGGMSLMDVEPVKPVALVLFGLTSAALAVGTRRTGRIHPPSFLRVGGAAIVAMALVAIGTGVATGEGDPAMLGMGAFFAVMGAVAVVIGVRIGRQDRAMSANLNLGRVAAVRLPRAELARRVALVRARHQREMRTVRRAVGAIVVTGVALFGLAQLPAVGAIIDGLPESVWMGVFFGFWGTVLGGMWWARRKERRAGEQDGLLCPSCDQPLLGSSGNMRLAKLIEDEGLCPQCGVLIVEDVPA